MLGQLAFLAAALGHFGLIDLADDMHRPPFAQPRKTGGCVWRAGGVVHVSPLGRCLISHPDSRAAAILPSACVAGVDAAAQSGVSWLSA